MENEKRKYEVTILSKVGTCDNTLFEKMAKKGDITATKLADLIGAVVKITGYSECNIVTDEKNFNVTYFDTEEYGLISSGSEVFLESVMDYFGETEFVKLTEIKTKKGKTYKAVPVLKTNKKEETKDDKEESDNDLPF